MKVTKLRQGYDIKLLGETVRTIEQAPFPKKVALKPTDFEGLKPKLLVKLGDEVKVGTPLAFDKKNNRIKIISHVSGKISEIVRGERRVIEAIVIEQDGKQIHKELNIDKKNLNKDSITEVLLESGLFLNFIQRPFNKIANPSDTPRDIFISLVKRTQMFDNILIGIQSHPRQTFKRNLGQIMFTKSKLLASFFDKRINSVFKGG